MDFVRRRNVIKETNILTEQYPHVLMLYKTPPAGEITLTEFEEIAFDRVQLLQVIEQATQMGQKLYSAEWKNAILGYLKKQGLRKYIRLLESTGCSSVDANTHIRREDYLSHFILRLAYCRSLDLSNWFIARELELFKIRFLNLSPEGIKKFMGDNNLYYCPITPQGKESIKDGLLQSTAGYSHVQIENSDFYKVPFTEVLDLVRNCSVYVKEGFAYIPTSDLVSCIMTWYRLHLNETMLNASKKLPSVEDERLIGLLSSLHTTYTGKDYTNADNQHSGITAENLHKFVRKSFPLCMRNLYEVIKTTHHMKHFGRLQFGLFLKGIGLNLNEAINYWKTEFCKLIDSEKFDKSYLYNIKHSFGSVGKMTNYTPYGCKKIISAEPASGEHHGCPFKLWDADLLKQKILEYGISIEESNDVVDLATKGHYQIACSKYFKLIHAGVESKQIINHPNQYFDESMEISSPIDIPVNSSENSTRKRKQPKYNIDNSTSENTTKESGSNQMPLDVSMFDDDYEFSDVA